MDTIASEVRRMLEDLGLRVVSIDPVREEIVVNYGMRDKESDAK